MATCDQLQMHAGRFAGRECHHSHAPYYSFLLERTPKGPPHEPRAWRKNEYSD